MFEMVYATLVWEYVESTLIHMFHADVDRHDGVLRLNVPEYLVNPYVRHSGDDEDEIAGEYIYPEDVKNIFENLSIATGEYDRDIEVTTRYTTVYGWAMVQRLDEYLTNSVPVFARDIVKYICVNTLRTDNGEG